MTIHFRRTSVAIHPNNGMMDRMAQKVAQLKDAEKKPPSVFAVLPPYRVVIMWLILLASVANVLTLSLPKLIATAVDDFLAGGLDV